jgi:hypothetical protein
MPDSETSEARHAFYDALIEQVVKSNGAVRFERLLQLKSETKNQ